MMLFQAKEKENVNLVAVGLLILATLIGFSDVPFLAAEPADIIRVP